GGAPSGGCSRRQGGRRAGRRHPPRRRHDGRRAQARARRRGSRSAERRVSVAIEALLEPVSEVARLAGAVALESFGARLAIESKADGSPVTAADRAAERAAREWIERRFPEDGIL